MPRGDSQSSTMTGVERVNRMLTRRDHDRVPRYESFWPQTLERWADQGLEGGKRGAYDLLDADVHELGWFEPQPFPGQHRPIAEDEQTLTYIDGFGATLRAWKRQGGTPEHVAFDCDSRASWEDTYKPALLSHRIQLDAGALRHEAGFARRRGRWTLLGTIEAYEFIKRLIGDEVALIAMATEPQWIVDVATTYTGVLLDNLAVAFDALPLDGVFLSADMAYNHGPLFSPHMYAELLATGHRQIIDFIHRRGGRVIFHTDGQVTPLVTHYLDVGIDSLHPLERAAGMDLDSLTRLFGDRLSFWGNFDKRVLDTGDRELVESEACRVLRAGQSRANYAFHSDHSIQPSVDLATYRHLVSCLDRWGTYGD